MMKQILKISKMNATKDESPLGIIAGGGALPFELVSYCKKIGRPFTVVGFKGQVDPLLLKSVEKSCYVRLGELKKPVAFLKQAGVKEIVLIGHIRRPSFIELRPDFTCLKLAWKLGFNRHGDDSILRLIDHFLQGYGFILKGIHEFLPKLLMPKGRLGKYRPNINAFLDIARGKKLLKFLSPQDIGQSAIIQDEMILGIEAIEGTDALIKRAATYKRKGSKPILVKMKKIGQNDRIDLPTIGPDTIRHLKKGGYAGVALEAGSTLIVSLPEVIKKADSAGIFLYGI